MFKFLFFFFSVLFPLSCSFLFLFLYSFFFFFFFFIINCSFNVPFFPNLISTSFCLYLNTITIGSLPILFNFSLLYHKLSLIYNKTFSIAYEHSSSFFLFSFAQNIRGVFFSKATKTFINSANNISLFKTIPNPNP